MKEKLSHIANHSQTKSRVCFAKKPSSDARFGVHWDGNGCFVVRMVLREVGLQSDAGASRPYLSYRPNVTTSASKVGRDKDMD